MNAKSGSVSIIDTTAMRTLRTVQLKPGLEYAALTPNGTLFVNDEDANEIEVVDIRRGTVAAPIALPGCTEPSGLAYDAKTDRLIAACANGKAAIVLARTANFRSWSTSVQAPMPSFWIRSVAWRSFPAAETECWTCCLSKGPS